MDQSLTPPLEGTRVQLIVSDPWDFVAADGSVHFAATVIRAATQAAGADEERLLVSLDEPAVWRESRVEFFVVRERHGHGIEYDLRLKLPIECALTAIDRARAEGQDPFDVSWWRGNLAASATLQAT